MPDIPEPETSRAQSSEPDQTWPEVVEVRLQWRLPSGRVMATIKQITADEPMSSAPKDGTVIMARGHDWGNRTNKKHYALAFYRDGAWHEVGSEGGQLQYLDEWRTFERSL